MLLWGSYCDGAAYSFSGRVLCSSAMSTSGLVSVSEEELESVSESILISGLGKGIA